ncbi:MAG: hypothetical protein DSO07_05185 [Thermoproteota archaeon]|nr:MAG: hypothetical protein DSO07_05185 [Candidatus Korarchaeota archaeon]
MVKRTKGKFEMIRRAMQERKERLRDDLRRYKILDWVPKKFWQNVTVELLEKGNIGIELIGDDYLEDAKVKKIVIHLSEPIVLSYFLKILKEKTLLDAIYHALIVNKVREEPEFCREMVQRALREYEISLMLGKAKKVLGEGEEIISKLKEQKAF